MQAGSRQRRRDLAIRREETVKIARIQSFLCDAGWRPWIFVKVETDDGLVGWGECSDGRNPHGVVGSIRGDGGVLLGQDPRAVGRLYCAMDRVSLRNLVRRLQ